MAVEQTMAMYKNRKGTPDSVPTIPARCIQMDPAYNGHENQEMAGVQPPYSYLALISMAIQSSPEKRLTVHGISDYITKNFPYYKDVEDKVLRRRISYHLSIRECFVKLPDKGAGKFKEIHYWTLNPNHEIVFNEGNYRRKRREITRYSGAEFQRQPSWMDNMVPMSPYLPLVNTNYTYALQDCAAGTTGLTGLSSNPSNSHIGAMVSSSPTQPFSPFVLSKNMADSASTSSYQRAAGSLITPYPPPPSFTYTTPLNAAGSLELTKPVTTSNANFPSTSILTTSPLWHPMQH